MQLKTIKEIKDELKRLRKRQNKHQINERTARKITPLRTELWRLLRQQPHQRKTAVAKKPKEAQEEKEKSGKVKGSGQYI